MDSKTGKQVYTTYARIFKNIWDAVMEIYRKKAMKKT